MILGGWEVERDREKQGVPGLCGCMEGWSGGCTCVVAGKGRGIYIYRESNNKVQVCFLVETFFSEFSPLRASSRPG